MGCFIPLKIYKSASSFPFLNIKHLNYYIILAFNFTFIYYCLVTKLKLLNMNTEIKEIFNLSEKMIFEVVAREKRPIILPDGEKIYRFEIHMIDLIGKNEGITVNELAKLLNVTKGAVSQVITKLEKSNIVNKIKAINNRKNVNLFLTTKGKAIFEEHKQFHDNIDNKIAAKFSKYSKNEIELIKSVLSDLQEVLSQL